MRVKGSIVRPLIGSPWSADTCPPATLRHETMLYERGSPFTLITAVTWHAVGCPSVLNIYVSTAVLPWWLSRLWHMLSLFRYLCLSLFPVSIKIQRKQKNSRKNTKTQKLKVEPFMYLPQRLAIVLTPRCICRGMHYFQVFLCLVQNSALNQKCN